MCGRFTLKTPPADWGQLLLPHLDIGSVSADWQPRYNIAPTQDIVAIVPNGTSGYIAQHMRWGLVPSWADDLAIGNRMINARSETLSDKPSFRTAFAKRRCAIVADGYYEWQTHGKAKQPFWIHRADKAVFAFAGLWESNRKASNHDVISATIITAAATEALAPMHDRMPTILSNDALLRWLDPATSAADAAELIQQRDVELETRPVSTHVNNPRHEDADCLA